MLMISWKSKIFQWPKTLRRIESLVEGGSCDTVTQLLLCVCDWTLWRECVCSLPPHQPDYWKDWLHKAGRELVPAAGGQRMAAHPAIFSPAQLSSTSGAHTPPPPLPNPESSTMIFEIGVWLWEQKIWCFHEKTYKYTFFNSER